jgi:hypothetical protein
MTEQQSYRVLETRGRLEVREYAPCVVADIRVPGSADQAGNRAFGPLAGYIGGSNRPGAKLAMTAPVLQEEAADPGWVVSFVLPGSGVLEDYPEPLDERVTLRAVPAVRAAAMGWSGRWTAGNASRHERELMAAVEEAGWTPVGTVRWARFDPPWKPPFLRRNESVVTLASTAQPTVP